MKTQRAGLLVASIVLIVFALTLFSHPVRGVSDPVYTEVTVTVAEAGAPGFTWTVTGCSASPSSGPSGTPTNVSLTPGCDYSINTGGDSGNGTLRDLLTSGYVDTIVETSCASGVCAPLSLTAHSEELLGVSAECNTPSVSVTSPSGDSWYDYGTTLSVTCRGTFDRSDGSGTRATSWHWNSMTNTVVATTSTFTTSPVVMDSSYKLTVNVVAQYQLTLDTGATRALASVTAPTIPGDKYWYDSGTSVTYTGYGVFERNDDGAGNRSASWYVDSGTPTTISTKANFTISVTMTAPHVVHVVTVEQWELTLNSVATPYLVSITAPTIKSDNYWYDSGTDVTLTFNGIGSRLDGIGTRLVSYTVNGGTGVPIATKGTVAILNAVPISGPEFIVVSSTTQYQVTLDASATRAMASITPTPIPGDDYWYDSGTQVTYTGNGVFSRTGGSGYRVTSWWWDSNASTTVITTGNFSASTTLTAPATLNVQIAKQTEISLIGTYGVASATSPTIPGDGYWYDTGTIVSLSLQVTFGRSDGSGWRMVSYVLNNGALESVSGEAPVAALSDLNLTSPQTITVQSVQQYEVSFDHGIASSLDSITPPSLSGDNYWYDAGSPVSLTVYGAWGRNATTGYRLSSYTVNGGGRVFVDTTGPVTILDLSSISGPQSITSNVTAQYLLTVTGGGGSVYSVPPSIPGDTGWYDSGTVVTVSTAATYYVQGSTRQRVASWSLDGGPATTVGDVTTAATSPIVMDAPHSVTFNSVTQYLVSIVVKDGSGRRDITPESITMSVNGGSQSAMSGQLWADDGSTVTVASILWEGVDVTPAQTGTYMVSAPFTITLDAKVYQATVVVKDILGIPVGGASVRLLLANSTTVQGTTAGNGSVTFRLIPLGTYQVTVSVLGISQGASGNAAVQNPMTITVNFSDSVVVVIVALVAAGATTFFLVRRHRRGPAF